MLDHSLLTIIQVVLNAKSGCNWSKMHFSFSLLLLGLTALTVFKLVSSIVTSYRRAAKAKAWGCEPAPQSTDHGFLGIKLIRRMQEADSKSIFPDFAMTRYNELCEAFGRPASTFRFSLLGRESFSTNDPKNIQAMLATQFDDFELGIMRRRNMIVLLGDGIVCPLLLSQADLMLMIRKVCARRQGLGTLPCHASGM